MNAIDTASRFEQNVKAGDFLGFAICMALAKSGGRSSARQIFEKRYPKSRNLEMIQRSAVSAGTTGGWGSSLATAKPFADAFVEFLRPLTVLGRMTGYRTAPLNVRFPRQTAGASVGWTGEGQPYQATALNFDQMTMEPAKVGGICVITEELAESSDPAAEAIIKKDLTGAIVQFLDEQLLDPSVGAVTDLSPASITHGATELDATCSTADAAAADLESLMNAITSNMIAPHLVMKPKTAIHLAAMGDRFPDVGAKGGSIWGVPVITSASTPADAASPPNNRIILVDAAELLVADDGIEISTSNTASVQMKTDPSADAAQMVSLFQTNSLGILVTRNIRWQMRHAGAVAYLNVPY